MIPTPAIGDLWEWVGEDPAIIFLIDYQSTTTDGYWLALNLTNGDIEEIGIGKHNAHNWRLLA